MQRRDGSSYEAWLCSKHKTEDVDSEHDRRGDHYEFERHVVEPMAGKGGVGFVHHDALRLSFHVVGWPLWSSSSTPIPASSSRMRSDSAKFLAARALALSSMSAFTRSSLMTTRLCARNLACSSLTNRNGSIPRKRQSLSSCLAGSSLTPTF